MCKGSKAGAGSVSRCEVLKEGSGLGGELPFPLWQGGPLAAVGCSSSLSGKGGVAPASAQVMFLQA